MSRATVAWAGVFALLAALTLVDAPAVACAPLAWAVLVVGVGAVVAPAASVPLAVAFSLAIDALVGAALAGLGELRAGTGLGALGLVMASAVLLRWRPARIELDPVP